MSFQSRLGTFAPRPGYAGVPEAVVGQGHHIEALYVHVPFCSSKCHYCDFYSIAGHLDEADAYLGALANEIALWTARLGRIAPKTIFIGGGTPTLLDPARLRRLLGLITGNTDCGRLMEFSVEANPNTFDEGRAAALAAAGVNRLSFGAQSFNRSELQTLQRDHDPENVARAFETALAAGIGNLNVDLIFGIPGQTLATWDDSLTQALQLGGGGPSHMSCYSLTYEPNTAMTARMKKGEFAVLDEELELAMFEHVYRKMQGAGFTRYEISNYARPGRECRHNMLYWKAANWLAWGPAAAGHLSGHRWKNVASLKHYVAALGAGGLGPAAGSTDFGLSAKEQPEGCTPCEGVLPLTQMEHLSAREWAAETAIFWLRLSEGLDYAEFRSRTGVDARAVLEPALEKFVGLGLVELLPTRVGITEKAIPVSNRILAAALEAFDESS